MKKLSISKRGKLIPTSPIRKLITFAEKAKKDGVNVYHVNIGDPDFAAPDKILNTLKKLAQTSKYFPYANSRGIKSNIQAWKKYYSDIGIDIEEEDVLVTSGSGEGIIIVLSLIADPEDELIVLEPFYANYASFANQASTKIVAAALDKNNNYHLPKPEEIIKRITPKTRAIFFTNPNNPTGTVFTRDEVKSIVQLAKKYNLFLISDETYYGMAFDGKKTVSAFEVADESEKQNIIVIDSLSKKLNIPGTRIGAIISKNKEVVDAVFRFAQARLSVATLEQEMVAPMLSDCVDYVSGVTKKYQRRRDSFLSNLEKELNIEVTRPEGAFYTMIKLPVDDAEKFAKWLLTDFRDKNETVMVAPGAGFYATPGLGKDEIRVAYVINEKDLARAAELIGLAVKQYNSTIRP